MQVVEALKKDSRAEKELKFNLQEQLKFENEAQTDNDALLFIQSSLFAEYLVLKSEEIKGLNKHEHRLENSTEKRSE